MRFRVPIPGAITILGYMEEYPGQPGKLHCGLDLAGTARASPVVPIRDGTIAAVFRYAEWRTVVIVSHDTFYSRYLHLEDVQVKRGQPVVAGVTVLGTTNTDDAHVHLDCTTGYPAAYMPNWEPENIRKFFIDPSLFLETPLYPDERLVIAEQLNVRAGPGMYKVVSSLKEGDKVKMLGMRAGWIRIGDAQWISARWVA